MSPVLQPVASASWPLCDAVATAELLSFPELVRAVEQAALEYDQGLIASPERMALPCGPGGTMLSMPAVAVDVAIHKLVNVQPANARRDLPTIHGLVSVFETATGRPLCILDGPEVTGRRTAAVSLLAMRLLAHRAPRRVLLYGTGVQARHHLRALAALHPGCTVWVKGRDPRTTADFCQQARSIHADVQPCDDGLPADLDVVITLTTSTQPVYDEEAVAGTLVIGVGAFRPDMAELGARTIAGSQCYADDPPGARHEAGDLLRAGVDWSAVGSLANLIRRGPQRARPALFKSVGTAAWDLAAARVALARLGHCG